MNDLDKWCAEQCEGEGLSWKVMVTMTGWTLVVGDGYVPFTILDPRCREIIRERFRFDTEAFSTEGWECYHRDMDKFFSGKTIAEAEIACITAIFEAEASSEAREAIGE